ncbi:transglutaminase N-terminal domain-containing protein [Kutzneria chonburiensis]|uniref:transglutaminase N-terminal domain-containing protein n=1 Tax=Kutzneria chonburiensis TaxID=1483604 RepID=UPI00235F03A3|nr:transglutaminase N-terminal domain-containing protein [Kutzneria chonburiensis]
MSWRLRVTHTTQYRYASPVTQSYNEVRLTPRSDRRQNVVVSRVETHPATRAYRYSDYWGTTVTSFDLHAPHTELTVVGSSVVETGGEVSPVGGATWTDLRGEDVLDRYTEYLGWTSTSPATASSPPGPGNSAVVSVPWTPSMPPPLGSIPR